MKSSLKIVKSLVGTDRRAVRIVATKRLNEQVKRNRERFPAHFMFQLTAAEKAEVVANCDHLRKLKFSPVLPYAFTEHGATSPLCASLPTTLTPPLCVGLQTPLPPLCVGLQTSRESLTEGLFLRIKLTSNEWAAMRSQFGTAWQTMKCAVTICDRIGDN